MPAFQKAKKEARERDETMKRVVVGVQEMTGAAAGAKERMGRRKNQQSERTEDE